MLCVYVNQNVNTRSACTKHNRYSYERMLSAGSRMVMMDLPCDDTSSNKTFCDKQSKQDRLSSFIETVKYGPYKSV